MPEQKISVEQTVRDYTVGSATTEFAEEVKGPHGIGLADKAPFTNPHPWARDLVFWLKAQKFAK
jgi:hypothetical protein